MASHTLTLFPTHFKRLLMTYSSNFRLFSKLFAPFRNDTNRNNISDHFLFTLNKKMTKNSLFYQKIRKLHSQTKYKNISSKNYKTFIQTK